MRLEGRAVPSAVVGDPFVGGGGVTTNTAVVGYTPAQVRAAYGFDRIPALAADYDATAGAGQTIAVVMAGDHPYVAGDLHVFSQQFGLPDAELVKLNQKGSAAGPWPAVNASWAGEIALDVEWAHAVAPRARIVLVEANSARAADLAAAIDTARRQPGVGVVSMSWGLLEGAGEIAYDGYLTTPAGHSPVAFVACSMDNGLRYPSNTYWPAASPNALAVGGTTLALAADGGYGSETAWGPSTGGVSPYEARPAYQAALGFSRRAVPDVAYHADNAGGHGFPVYTTVPQDRQIGWFNSYGTSAGAPQWAALVALADQQRAAAGLPPLDGPTQVLPGLYNLAGTTPFRDVATGANGKYAAGPGYDLVTGLGTPRADQLVGALAALPAYAPPTNSSAPPSGSVTGTAAVGGGFGLPETELGLPSAPPDEVTGKPKANPVSWHPAPDHDRPDPERCRRTWPGAV
jgi:subtilase family serine protease